MQLLRITTTPIKYEFQVENPKLEYQQDVTPSSNITISPSRLNIQSQNAEIQINTYEARKSIGLSTFKTVSSNLPKRAKSISQS